MDTQHTPYGLAWNPRPQNLRRNLLLCSVFSGVSIVVSGLAVLAIPGGFLGVGALYFASVFYALVTYWFGAWGLIASFIGAFIGAGLLTGMPIFFALPFAVADIFEPLLPVLILRTIAPRLGIHPLAGNLLAKPWSRYALFCIFGAALPPFLSGLWGTWILTLAGFVPPTAFFAAVFSWWFGAFVLLAILVPPIASALSGYLHKTGLACHGWLS
ncbi:MAG: hypothetical protein IT577_22190 [Verrucomicrobiae bacterium]|nr:hypothetical protein [Verrucomicrobiae bacterium]